MPRITHETLVQLVRRAPDLIPALMWPDQPPPPVELMQVTAGEFVDLQFAEYRADSVVKVREAPGHPAEVFVVEAQMEIEPRKRRVWPHYVTGLGLRFDCPTTLVVLAPIRRVADWAARWIDLGRGRMVHKPCVLGPHAIPIITDPDRARAAPELAVLSVIAHADEPGAEHIALAALMAAHDLDDERSTYYPDAVFAQLNVLARAALEKLMTTTPHKYQSDFARKYYDQGIAEGKAEGKAEGLAQGEAKGKAEILLKLVLLRGFALTDADRERVLGCTDQAILDLWAARVLTATSLGDVLDGPA